MKAGALTVLYPATLPRSLSLVVPLSLASTAPGAADVTLSCRGRTTLKSRLRFLRAGATGLGLRARTRLRPGRCVLRAGFRTSGTGPTRRTSAVLRITR
jgi:hypothetical protein